MQKQYYCDQRVVGETGEEGCTVRVRATRQVTGEFKVAFVGDDHVNRAGSTTTATIHGMKTVLLAAMNNTAKIQNQWHGTEEDCRTRYRCFDSRALQLSRKDQHHASWRERERRDVPATTAPVP